MEALYVQIAVPLPLDQLFTYRVPPEFRETVAVGKRILAPFGKRMVTGYIVSLADYSDIKETKDLLDVLDREPVVSPELLELFRWAAAYYLAPLGEVIKCGLPPGINAETSLHVIITETGEKALTEQKPTGIAGRILTLLKEKETKAQTLFRVLGRPAYGVLQELERQGWVELRQKLQAAQVKIKAERFAVFRPEAVDTEAYLRLKSGTLAARVGEFLRTHGEAAVSDLNSRFPRAANAVKRLEALGIIDIENRAVERDPLAGLNPAAADRPPELSPDQARAVKEMDTALQAREFTTYLLFGVTGSGKTEVYLRLIEKALAQGRTALCLVPEISLTPLAVDRFRARFGDRLAVLHSGLTEGERFDQWRRIFNSQAEIVVGARSAIFAPLKNLGLIVVDEEHDSSYKQDDGFCYQALDLALRRAQLAEALVVLGSATPSLESLNNAEQGKYRLFTLPQRVAARPMPEVTLVDMRRKNEEEAVLSVELSAALEANLAAGRQALVFLNRRGFANFLICPQCGHVFKCANCAVSLTFHRERGALNCHYCDYHLPAPDFCPRCRGYNLRGIGVGTEQLEEELKCRFPQAVIARMDRDTTSGWLSCRRIFDRVSSGEIDILVGTQMIAKGHDFPGVTLVGVVGADIALHLPDFRAGERTFQLLTQIAGRAGRGDMPGTVYIQTYFPEHYAIRAAKDHDVKDFAAQELQLRAGLSYPPQSRLALLRLSAVNEKDLAAAAYELAVAGRAILRRDLLDKHVSLLGPATPPLAKLQGRFRRQILLKASSPARLKTFLKSLAPALKNIPARIRVDVDIDPYNLL